MKASARANKPHGYKAVVVHKTGRTEILGTRWTTDLAGETHFHRAAPNYKTRQEAIDAAQRTIDYRERESAIRNWLFHNRDENGRRQTREQAIKALGLDAN